MTDYARTIPVLASLDLDRSKRFYTEKLGFAAERYGDYLIVKRDEMEMHFWLTDDRISDFEVRPWNMKEFYACDPHGNLLTFGCAPEEI